MKPPPPVEESFFAGSTVAVARRLLGAFLVSTTRAGTAIGRIVETEAYLADDPACHAFRGETARNRVMFGPPGHAYIYFIYGMHYCFNVVTRRAGVGEAVLIRALEPVSGICLMERRRRTAHRELLANGPAKLVTALGIKRRHNGHPLNTPPLYIAARESFRALFPPPRVRDIEVSRRRGISQGKEFELRYSLGDNLYVS